MAISFHAEFVRVAKEEWGWQVLWSVDKDLASELYLSLERADKSNLLDVIFGRAQVYCGRKVHIECCSQARSWYGHIVSFELRRDRVLVELDAKAARQMHDDGRLEVTFELSSERFAKLQSALGEVFRGYGYYKNAA